jgi:hypothetical protein
MSARKAVTNHPASQGVRASGSTPTTAAAAVVGFVGDAGGDLTRNLFLFSVSFPG